MIEREPEHCPECDSLVQPGEIEIESAPCGSNIAVDVRVPYLCGCGKKFYWNHTVFFRKRCFHPNTSVIRSARCSNGMQLEDLRCDDCGAEFPVLKVVSESKTLNMGKFDRWFSVG